MDPLGIGMAKAAESTGAEVGKVFSRLLGPSADELGRWMADAIVAFRARNAQRILEKAAAKADLTSDGHVPPRVAHQILDEGSLCDDELMTEYLSGVLAASRTPDGRDDRGATWSRFITGMSALEVRLHFLLYRAWDELLLDRPDFSLWSHPNRLKARLWVHNGEAHSLLTDGLPDPPKVAMSHAVLGLQRRGLIEDAAWGSREHVTMKGHPFTSVLTAVPTLVGVELYGWGLGIAGLDPNTFHEEERPELDPSMPRLQRLYLDGVQVGPKDRNALADPPSEDPETSE